MVTDEQRERMHELFRSALEAERAEVPPRDTASLHISDAAKAFPELDGAEVQQLALQELHRNWVPVEQPEYTDEGRLYPLWFTDAAGGQRVRERSRRRRPRRR